MYLTKKGDVPWMVAIESIMQTDSVVAITIKTLGPVPPKGNIGLQNVWQMDVTKNHSQWLVIAGYITQEGGLVFPLTYHIVAIEEKEVVRGRVESQSIPIILN